MKKVFCVFKNSILFLCLITTACATGHIEDCSDAGADAFAGDLDSDGYTVEQGDCDDRRKLVNPGAMEDLGDAGAGDEVDNDCDGQTDEAELCDTSLVGVSAEDLARAMNLCDARFLLGAKKIFSSPNGHLGFDTLKSQGSNYCLVARQGSEMAALSTGPIGQENPNHAVQIGGIPKPELDPMPEYQNHEKQTGEIESCCDVAQIELNLKSPANAVGFSFDFLFATAEYDEWVERGYNDTFYAVMIYKDLNLGATTNIAFDDIGHEIEVDSNFFENAIHPCDETGSGWEPEVEQRAGSTGWLRTSWEVSPAQLFKLTFSIHDEGDCGFDSIAFIDNFRWLTQKVKNQTIIVE